MAETDSKTRTKHERNLATIIHASTFSKYFIPFGNFILPLLLWHLNKNEYKFVDYNGKQALNFQLSLLLYSIILGIITVPFFIGFLPNIFEMTHFNDFSIHWNSDHFNFRRFWPIGITGLLQGALFVVNIVYTILAILRTNEGQMFKYPITINFIK